MRTPALVWRPEPRPVPGGRGPVSPTSAPGCRGHLPRATRATLRPSRTATCAARRPLGAAPPRLPGAPGPAALDPRYSRFRPAPRGVGLRAGATRLSRGGERPERARPELGARPGPVPPRRPHPPRCRAAEATRGVQGDAPEAGGRLPAPFSPPPALPSHSPAAHLALTATAPGANAPAHPYGRVRDAWRADKRPEEEIGISRAGADTPARCFIAPQKRPLWLAGEKSILRPGFFIAESHQDNAGYFYGRVYQEQAWP